MRVSRPIRNPWPFTRRATKPSRGRGAHSAGAGAATCGRRSSATVTEAVKAAYKAGHNKGDTGLFDSWACERGFQDRGTPVLKRLRAEFERGVEDAIRGVRLVGSSEQGRPAPAPVPSTPRVAAETYKGYKVRQDENGDWYSSLDSDSTFESKAAAKAHIDNWRKRPNPRKRTYTRAELERLDPAVLDRMAYGFASGDTRTVPLSVLVPVADDLENAGYQAGRYKGGPIAWARSVDLSEPIEVRIKGGRWIIHDGHHRYYAAFLLKHKTIRAVVEIEDNSVSKILGEPNPRKKLAPRPTPPSDGQPPDTGQQIYIQTDDGKLYWTEDFAHTTHIHFARKRGIPSERIVAGGWITDGVMSDNSTRSDSMRYGERGRASMAVGQYLNPRGLRHEMSGALGTYDDISGAVWKYTGGLPSTIAHGFLDSKNPARAGDDRGYMSNPYGEPTGFRKEQKPYYVHGLHGAKTPTLAGSYWTKPEAMRAAQQLANEEGEEVTVSTPKRDMFTVKPKPGRAGNPSTKRRYGVEPQSIGGGYTAFWREGDEWKYSPVFRDPKHAMGWVEDRVIPNRWSGAKLVLPWKEKRNQWGHYTVDVTMPKVAAQSNPYVEDVVDDAAETVLSEIPVFQASREELPGVAPFVEYTTLQEAMAYAQAVKGLQPGVCVVGFGEDSFGVVLNADEVRAAEAGTVGERVLDVEVEPGVEIEEMENPAPNGWTLARFGTGSGGYSQAKHHHQQLQLKGVKVTRIAKDGIGRWQFKYKYPEAGNPDQSKRSVATDTAEREGRERGVTDARYLRPMKSMEDALSYASAYVRHYNAEVPDVGEFYYDGYTHGYTSAARDVAKFAMGPYDKRQAEQQAGDLKRQGYEDIEVKKEKSPYGGYMYHVYALTRDTRKHPVPGRATKQNPAGADDAHYVAQLRRNLQTATGAQAKYIQALLKFYDHNGRLPSGTDARADALQNPVRRGAGNTRTKKLTVRKDLYFVPESGQGLASLRAGEKVSVTWSPGTGYATAYMSHRGQMYSHSTPATKAHEEYKNWPADWDTSGWDEEGRTANPEAPSAAPGSSFTPTPDSNARVRQQAKARGGYASSWSPWMYYPEILDINGYLHSLQETANFRRVTFKYEVNRKEGGGWSHYDHDKGTIKPAPASKRRNPSSGVEDSRYAADAMFEDFHGKQPTEVIRVETEIVEPTHLAVLGSLVSIVVATVSGLEVTLGFESDPPYLCSSPDGTQLYIQGGNQCLDLQGLKMAGEDWERQHMVIGEMTETTYRTEKSFDKFQTIDYYHANGEESGVLPQLVYDPINKVLGVAGGRYKVLPEGIVD